MLLKNVNISQPLASDRYYVMPPLEKGVHYRSLFVFMNRRQTQLKALYWDGDGYVIWAKRLRKRLIAVR